MEVKLNAKMNHFFHKMMSAIISSFSMCIYHEKLMILFAKCMSQI